MKIDSGPAILPLLFWIFQMTFSPSVELVPTDLTSSATLTEPTIFLEPQASKSFVPPKRSPVWDSSRFSPSLPTGRVRLVASNSSPLGEVEPNPLPNLAEPSSAKVEVRPLRLQLHELILLRQAAQRAGGDLEVSIRPIGITTEDLLIPLVQGGSFAVKADEGSAAILVQSKTIPPALDSLNSEIDRLERRRRALLNDLAVLETVPSAALNHPAPTESSNAPLVVTLSPRVEP